MTIFSISKELKLLWSTSYCLCRYVFEMSANLENPHLPTPLHSLMLEVHHGQVTITSGTLDGEGGLLALTRKYATALEWSNLFWSFLESLHLVINVCTVCCHFHYLFSLALRDISFPLKPGYVMLFCKVSLKMDSVLISMLFY